MSSIVDSVLPLLGKAPKAKVLTDPKKRKGEAPFSVTFDGSRSVDPDGGNIVEYQWDFGDGSAEVAGPEAVVTHIYTGPGSFSATLQVIDDEGTQSKKAATRRIIVKE
jgi:PKD repeat protein